MPNSSTDAGQLLTDLLLRLVEIQRRRKGFTWELLRRVSAGRVGRIELDGHRLRLEASEKEPYALDIRRDDEDLPLHFRADGATLLQILRGRLTLDRAMIEGRVATRAKLADLLGIYLLVMSILADAPVDREIRGLLHEWEATWPYLESCPRLQTLETQAATHGPLVRGIPRDLLEMTEYVEISG